MEDARHSDDRLAYAPERPRGILTQSDRDFLLGRKTDYADPSKRQKRTRIRRRIRNAVLDVSIIFEHLDDRDREMVFDPEDTVREAHTQGIIDMLGVLYLGTIGYRVPFERMLARGVNRSEQTFTGSDYRMVTVDFDVESVGQIDVDEVVDKLESNDFDGITDEELRAFVRLLAESDEFSVGDLRSAMKAQMTGRFEEVDGAAEQRNPHVDRLPE